MASNFYVFQPNFLNLALLVPHRIPFRQSEDQLHAFLQLMLLVTC